MVDPARRFTDLPRRRRRKGSRELLVAALCGLGLAGCGDLGIGPELCDRPESGDPIAFRGGTLKNGVYMSSDWDGELLHFTGGAYYVVYHRLGEQPRWVQLYLSFERDGLGSASVAPAAGNQAEIKAIDSETITVLNGSCVNYFLLVIAGAGD